MYKIYQLIFIFGFTSGFTLLISGSSLNFWLAKSEVDLEVIGLFSLAALPYSFNFLWSPIIDRFSIPIISKKFGQRLSWLIILHLSMAILVYILSLITPQKDLIYFMILTFTISLFSSTKDAVLNGWRAEMTAKNKQGFKTSIYIFGYRSGLLISSSGSIYLSSFLSWNSIYLIYAISTLLFPILIYFYGKSNLSYNNNLPNRPENLFNSKFKGAIITIFRMEHLLLIILTLILYRLPDNMFGAMINAFSLNIGFNEIEIASIGKFLGVFGSIIGGFIGGVSIDKMPILRSLYYFGAIHAVSHLLFIFLIDNSHNLYLYSLIVGFQSITGGMAMTCYVAYITSLCSGYYQATQYSFFSASMGLSRSIFPTISGYIATQYGWSVFFIIIFLISIPSLILIKILVQKTIAKQ